ncbi:MULTISPECIES: GGDEF domain-containing protein [unclassified Novosphingobium]|uniref:GGDEF domain-containing protein n=1 Tax=unclassified Novosphingobium TaxID=2644732 RepID=UPI00146CF2C5|nr:MULTISPECIES: GGDEF domain-containing protein [unclassified Novosphingobium]NMN06276.1 diguanylate cyclase (GGDEF)-like protein [Novosphingobium sp. SG919]NMN88574.1 diguanylate cyclase (GGDEF)-like protein [Novosphingobium sp. SG916]
MRFYLATSFIFPRSLRLRLFTVCFVTTHVPLASYCAWGLATGRIELAEFVLLTLATVIGAIMALLGIGALLDPIHALAQSLNTAENPALPPAMDVIQSLYAGVHRAAVSTGAQIQALVVAAQEDALTGILNRRGFLDEIVTLINDGVRGCVVLLDVDYFKSVNDTLGHDEGDRILGALAALLSRQTRRVDLVARWGGEEFVVFLPGCVEEEASRIMGRIAQVMRQAPIGQVGGRAITFSAGISACTDGDVAAAVLRADEALYCAKDRGRDQVVCHATQRDEQLATLPRP